MAEEVRLPEYSGYNEVGCGVMMVWRLGYRRKQCSHESQDEKGYVAQGYNRSDDRETKRRGELRFH